MANFVSNSSSNPAHENKATLTPAQQAVVNEVAEAIRKDPTLFDTSLPLDQRGINTKNTKVANEKNEIKKIVKACLGFGALGLIFFILLVGFGAWNGFVVLGIILSCFAIFGGMCLWVFSHF